MTRLRAPRDVARRPSSLKLLLRRQKRFLRPALWGVTGFALVMAAILGLRSAQPGGLLARLGDSVAHTANLQVQHIIVNGQDNTPDVLLKAALGVRTGDPILAYSIQDARKRLESLSWVEAASVARHLPDTLVFTLTERRPIAIWQREGAFKLIDRDGNVVENQPVAANADLPLVVGEGAERAAASLLKALDAQPQVKSHVAAAVRVGQRRWNLRMKSGGDVLLPEGAEIAALAKLAELQTTEALLDRPVAAIDMRLADRLVVRPLPTPAPVGKKA